MPTLTEIRHAGGFLVWEALRDYCRSTVVLASGNLQPGTILGKITASGKYAAHDPAAVPEQNLDPVATLGAEHHHHQSYAQKLVTA